MATLTLAPQHTWFDNSKVKRATITQIDIVNSYTPTGSETTFWDASEDKDGSVMCYVIGTQLIIAGNGSGKIYANADSSFAFCEAKDVSNPRDYFSALTTINGFDIFDVSKATTFNTMFYKSGLTEFKGAEQWNTENVTSMTAMFANCPALANVDCVSNWNTSGVVELNSIFQNCPKLTNLECIYNWDMSNVKHAGRMFYGCSGITEYDLNKWDMSSVLDINHMFCDNRNLKTLKISNWDISNCTLFFALFNDCVSLETIDLSGWNTKSARSFAQMFERCKSLKRVIGIENFDTSSFEYATDYVHPYTNEFLGVTSELNEFFYGCTALEEIDLSSFDTRKVGAFVRMFADCTSLKTVYVGDLWGTENVANGQDKNSFLNCTNIVGEDGTTYDSNKINLEYAKIDGDNGTAGYLTHIRNTDKDTLVNGKYLYRTAKAIRNKLGTTDKYLPSEMADAIRSIGAIR